MRLRIASEELRHFEIALGDLAATLWLAAGDNRWRLSYTAGERHGCVEIAPGRTPWESALRRALADCEMHVGAVG